MILRRLGWPAMLVLVLTVACGSGEMTLTEYVDAYRDLVHDAADEAATLYASPEGRVLAATNEELVDHDPSELQIALIELGRIERNALTAAAEIEPPAVLAELHELYFDDTFTIARENLAERAGSATSWEELSASPEMEAYRAAVARDREVCLDIQEILNRTEVLEAFEDTPWVPADLKEVVDAALGCTDYVDDPWDMFRPPGA